MNAARALALLLLTGTAPAASFAQSAPPAWQDSKLAPEARAAALVRAMTHAEKLQLIHGLFPPRAQPAPADMIPSAGYVPGIPRLGIPTLRESDASLGVANQVEQRKGDVATALPSGLATAATFDPELARAGGAMIGAEARAKTFNVLLAGGVNLTRDAWNGRNFEYLGEDPILAGTLAGAAIDGVQSNHIVSTIKHFILNAQETGRTVLNARIDEAALRESDLLAFEIAIQAGKPGSVMCAYNRIEGDYACESARMLTGVLRRDWGYTGWVMSDWGAVHSTVKAAMSGLDQESGQELDHEIYFAPEKIDAAIQAGQISTARLDEMVTRILTGVIASGLYDHPTPTTAQPIDYAAHAEVAQRVAEAGMVLLRNEGDLLPLATSAKKIVLIGGHADVGVLSGGGSSQVRSVGGAPVEIPLTSGAAASFARVTWHASSPLQAIRAKAPQAQVTYVDGSDPAAAARAARSADMVVLFATQWATEAQDVDSLSLPDNQDALITAVARANPKTVVVLETGGPVLMPWLEQVPAVLQAWYPGQRGGEAIAGILFGDVNPSGRLPISFPKSADQLPRPKPVVPAGLNSNAASDAGAGDGSALPSWDVTYSEGANVGYRWYATQGTQPLFPFGYGLSYTRFGFSDARFTGGAAPSVTVTVRNQGARAGVVVPQLYVTGPDGGAPRLAAWKRQALKPGEAAQVTLTADRHALVRWKDGRWVIPAGKYRLAVGQDSASATMMREVEVPAGAIRK
ncbi:beta-glucosidase [Sphingomonas sp. ABOLE]|uniref:beta-glucosidase n=1 Tax=Sphingomonas sp. ABOLE TaxID=1985878 RepID=UPI000F7DF94A|nr:glycoside hydrolase family 3 protein [Sphingomonas sp. ABOLE]RSV39633.1 beta-glucosidase [Sphingomonas sp. ABOLE]